MRAETLPQSADSVNGCTPRLIGEGHPRDAVSIYPNRSGCERLSDSCWGGAATSSAAYCRAGSAALRALLPSAMPGAGSPPPMPFDGIAVDLFGCGHPCGRLPDPRLVAAPEHRNGGPQRDEGDPGVDLGGGRADESFRAHQVVGRQARSAVAGGLDVGGGEKPCRIGRNASIPAIVGRSKPSLVAGRHPCVPKKVEPWNLRGAVEERFPGDSSPGSPPVPEKTCCSSNTRSPARAPGTGGPARDLRVAAWWTRSDRNSVRRTCRERRALGG